MSEIENFITISKYQIDACLPIVLWREEAESLIDEIETLIERISELEERIKELYADNEFLRESYPHFIETEGSDVN